MATGEALECHPPEEPRLTKREASRSAKEGDRTSRRSRGSDKLNDYTLATQSPRLRTVARLILAAPAHHIKSETQQQQRHDPAENLLWNAPKDKSAKRSTHDNAHRSSCD